MTSQLNVDTIVDKAGSGGTNVKVGNTSTYVADGGSATQNLVQAVSKAWVNFDGASSNIPINDSFNVSGNTDNGTGDYTITYSNAMANGSYSLAGVGQAGGGGSVMGLAVNSTGGLTTASARIFTKTGSPADSDLVTSTINGDLA